MYAKIFGQIFDSSIAEDPEVRFTFMDMLILADKEGIVDMTHEAISRRTNRPIQVILDTIKKLENPDARSRTPDADGRRIRKLDEHRDWGWVIVNYDRFRDIGTEVQRQEKTRARVQKYREKLRESGGVTPCNAPVTLGNDPVTPVYTVTGTVAGTVTEPVQQTLKLEKFKGSTRMSNIWEKWMSIRMASRKPKRGWDELFACQAEWLSQFDEQTAFEILQQSIVNDWQGLFEPKQKGSYGKNNSRSTEVNIRNVGVCPGVTDYGAAAKRKLERQLAEREEEARLAREVDQAEGQSQPTGKS